jgi:hypothetical protein
MTLESAFKEFKKAKEEEGIDRAQQQRKIPETARLTPPQNQETQFQQNTPKANMPAGPQTQPIAPVSFERSPAGQPEIYQEIRRLNPQVQNWIKIDLDKPDGVYTKFIKNGTLDFKNYFAAMSQRPL